MDYSKTSTNEKFETLKSLFRQRDEIDTQIIDIIGDDSKPIIMGVKTTSKVKLKKVLSPTKAEVTITPKRKYKPRKKFTKWSRLYECCTECGTTEVKHRAKGFCRDCYRTANKTRDRDVKQARRVKKRKAKKAENVDYSGVDKVSSGPHNYKCVDCNTEFKSVLSPNEDPFCPECTCRNVFIVK